MNRIFWAFAAALVACRFYAFLPDLDHPHLFRQADTAFYSLGFYRFGMNIFMPSVGWMGAYRHVVLEFPLTEWISAWVYTLTGPTILVDRLVNLAFFLGSAFYLIRIVRLVAGETMGSIVATLYMAAPLGIYYSRAVHIDFTAVCFAHALLFYTMRLATSGRSSDLARAVACGTFAFVIKAPYAFYLIVPALVFCYQRRATRIRWAAALAPFAVSAFAFVAWFLYTQRINRQAPDLSFIPSYYRHVDRYGWYLGTLADRVTLEPWRTVIGRIFREIAVTIWWVVVPFGWHTRARLAAYYAFTLAWTVGTLIYLVLFLTLNEMHSYYQIPFIAPFCLWLAAPIYSCWTATGSWARTGRVVALSLLVAYAASSLFVARQRFYWTDPGSLAMGEFVRARTSEDDLVVMASTDATHADPSYLFYARRYGWSVGSHELSPRVIEGLLPWGADVVVTSTVSPPDDTTRAYLDRWPLVGTLPIEGGQIVVRRLTPPRRSP